MKFENGNSAFGNSVRKKADEYFAANNLSKFAGIKTWIKIILFPCAFVIPYLLLIISPPQAPVALLLCVTMGIAMAGIGFAISHPAAHNALSPNKKVNRLLSLSFNLVGMSDYIWKIKHNVFHHTYTNVYEMDEALKEGDLLRLSSDAPLKSMHRYQHYYGFFVYALFTVFWAFLLDFEKLTRYHAHGKRKPEKHPAGELVLFWVTKLYYVCICFLVPHYITGYSWTQVLAGFFILHIVASTIITHVLQVEHIAEEIIPAPAANNGIIGKPWAENQLEGTCNFRVKNKWFNWYISACNYQVEHHLFPGICPEHYPALSKIVKQAATEHGLKYHLQPSFRAAVSSHYQMLKNFGNRNFIINEC